MSRLPVLAIMVYVLEVKNRNQVGPRCHLGSNSGTNRSHVLLLPHEEFLRHWKEGPKYTLAKDPTWCWSLMSKSQPSWVHAATWGQVVELTGHIFFSYPMEYVCVTRTWVQSVLWPRTQLRDGT